MCRSAKRKMHGEKEEEMKNTDIAMVIFIAAISVVLSYFIGNAVLGDPNDKVVSLSYMDRISDSVEDPDGETFNPVAKNPTVEVYVGNCGALEEWIEAERTCRLRPEFQDKNEEEEKKNENQDSDADTETDIDTDSDADEGTGGN